MTTFTKFPEGEKPLIEVDAGKKLSKIDDMIYGGFTEYVLIPIWQPCIRRRALAQPRKAWPRLGEVLGGGGESDPRTAY